MSEIPYTGNRLGPRYVAAFPIRAEWDTNDGEHIVAEGETENIGPDGTLVHLQRELPPVGSLVNLLILGENDGEKLRVIAEVLRIVRNPAHPQAALHLVGETDEWRGVVWKEGERKKGGAYYELDEDELL